MKNFNWKEFREGREIAVHCNTEEKAKNFFEECMNNGIVAWCGGESLIQNDDTEWGNYRAETCYSNTDNIEYDGLEWFQENSYKIVEWTLEDNEAEIDITVVNQEQTEFTYQEVIARIKDGEYYRCTRDDLYKVKDIKMEEGNIILIGNIHDGVGISIKQLFVQEEYKQEYEIYYITFPDSEEQFQFRYDPSTDDDYMSLGEIVICNLDNDKKAYGKVSDLKEVSMTEKEYLELNLIKSID